MDILTPYTTPIEFDLPIWVRWLLPVVYLLFDGAIVRKFTRWSLVNGLRLLFRWTMNKFIEQVANKTAPIAAKIVVDSLRNSMEEMASEEALKLETMTSEQLLKLEQMISERLLELEPKPPPHGITGTLVPLSGLYRLQGEHPWLVERTFEEGDIFPSAATDYDLVGERYIGKNEEKVTWVYQTPESEPSHAISSPNPISV